MNPFTVMKKRGHILAEDSSEVDRRRLMNSDGDYNLASGPKLTAGARKPASRDYRMPVDLTRSRRVGLSRTVCGGCGAVYDQGHARHSRYCAVPATELGRLRVRETTGPLGKTETTKQVPFLAA